MLHSLANKHFLQKARSFIVLAFLVFLLTAFIPGCDFDADSDSYAESGQSKLQRARVIKVKDGDSLILRFENSVEKEVRLFGVDALAYRYL